ncbi:MAG TPA: hypothetical protein VNN80_14810 [Polyangiaceae bacterium]|nr:hypothetical protein [Polyangiaceae bacterium]
MFPSRPDTEPLSRFFACLGLSLAFACALLLWSGRALAGPNDAAATQAINQAMDEYLKTKDADAAEGRLLEAIALCGKDCKSEVLAQAWMYTGIVKGNGQKDWDTAREAFSVALGFDDKVQLDPRFFNPTAQALFDGIKNQQKPADPANVVAGFEPGTQMGCVPLVQEVEVSRPIPISCSTRVQGVSGVVLRYRQYGDENWKRIDLKRNGDEWRGEIPCAELARPGTWGMYVEARDERDNALERIGARDKPLVFKVVEKTSAPPPALPGEPPPDKCVQTAYCPDEMIGTPACEALKGGPVAAKETACKQSSDCDLGMSCVDSVCKAQNVCTEDSDCTSDEMCQAGLCVERPRASKLDWFGVHFGVDFTSVPSASNVCDPDGSGEYACFDGDQAYEGTPYPGSAGEVPGGIKAGTLRVMFSYDRFLLENLSLGARFGFAFNGAPEDFFPLHFEARGTYYFGNVTQGRSRFTPYVAVGIGLAQVDTKVPVQIVDCLPDSVPECLAAPEVNEQLIDPETGAARVRDLDAYKSLGTVFGNISPGIMVALTREISAVGNIGVLLMTDSEAATSLVLNLQPSLGVVLGF